MWQERVMYICQNIYVNMLIMNAKYDSIGEMKNGENVSSLVIGQEPQYFRQVHYVNFNKGV